jgi:hypothetical protein
MARRRRPRCKKESTVTRAWAACSSPVRPPVRLPAGKQRLCLLARRKERPDGSGRGGGTGPAVKKTNRLLVVRRAPVPRLFLLCSSTCPGACCWVIQPPKRRLNMTLMVETRVRQVEPPPREVAGREWPGADHLASRDPDTRRRNRSALPGAPASGLGLSPARAR